MRKLFSICLLAFLVANVAGFYIYFYFRLVEIKREMRTELLRTSPSSFEKISLSRDEYEEAREGDDELEWREKMYDIGTIKIDGSRVEILALADEAETNLLALMGQLLHAAAADSKSTPTSLVQYLTLTFTLPYFSSPDPGEVFISVNHLTAYLELKSDSHSEIISPPPQA